MIDIEKSEITDQQKNQLIASLSRLKGKRILILGDVGLDEYVQGHVRRISPEAPVPVLEVESEDQRLGLAANVAQNVQSLGGQALLVSAVGADQSGEKLGQLIQANQISKDHLVLDPKRPTTRKTRVMAQHHHLVRVDYELKRALDSEVEKLLLRKVEDLLPTVDVVVVEDYAKGVVSESLVLGVLSLCKRFQRKVLVDPHRETPGRYYFGADLIKPNFDEAVALAGLNYDSLRENPNRVYETGLALKELTQAKDLVLTRGKDGMTIFSQGRIIDVPTFAKKVFDVTGAGDTVIAALALGTAAELPLVESCWLANFAAGVVVGKVGCVPCPIPELVEYIEARPEI